MKDLIYVSAVSDIPIYLQIAHQMTYLIYSRQLAENDKLPPMRDLADHLSVNPNTVAQAYGELKATGLVDSQRGRGTFVKPQLLIQDSDWSQRRILLGEELQKMRQKARALGFSDGEIQQQLLGLAHSLEQPCDVLYVGYTDISSERYATALTERLSPYGVRVRPITIDEIVTLGAKAASALELSYFVITYVTLRQKVEDLLKQQNRLHQVLGISLEITEETIRRVTAIEPQQKLCVFSQDRYQAIVLNVLQSHSTVAHAEIRKVLEGASPETVHAFCDEADLVIHTIGVRPVLDSLGIPREKRLELTFQASHDSLTKLQSAFSNRSGSDS